MPAVDNEVLAITTINLLDRLINKLIENGILSADDAQYVADAAIVQVRDANNPRAGDVEALIRKMYPS